MERAIVCYSLGNREPAKRLKFNHQLYGYTDRSNFGKYIYKREGILKEGTYERPFKGVIIISYKDADKVKKHMADYGAKYILYRIKE